MQFYIRFFKGFVKDIKFFLWLLALFTVFRLVFILLFKDQLANGLDVTNLGLTLWYGLRISLKTSGIFTLLTFLLATVVGTVWKLGYERIVGYIRNALVGLTTFIFTLLFCVRIPYYTIFNASFNLMLINGANDDWRAILDTAVESYGLLWRLPIAIILGLVLSWLSCKWVQSESTWLETWANKTETLSKKALALRSAVLLVVIVASSIFIRFGGAFTYSGSINWENAGRLPSQLLNEAVLDDGQALYRVYTSHRRLENATKLTISEDELKQMITATGGNAKAPTIDAAYTKTITTPRLEKQPNTVVFVLGETYALWPFTDGFKGTGDYLVSEGLRLAKAPNGFMVEGLAHGTGTMPAVNGYLTGLPDTGLYANYEKESYREPYGFGIANVMKRLGYKTVFWYGGFGAWQDVRNFALAQGFDEFKEAGEFTNKAGNAWGVPDKVLFEEVTKYMKAHQGEKVFHFILTTSNHPPYDIDVKGEGYDANKVAQNEIMALSKDDKTVNEMGHIWYADQMMGRFVKGVESFDPEALFVVTGDHGERFTFAKEVDKRTNSGVPIIVYGKGIQHNWALPQQYASSLQLIPTLAELVGRPGDTYESLVPSLFEPTPFAFNHALWIDKDGYHSLEEGLNETQKTYITDLRTIAIWRIIKGNSL